MQKEILIVDDHISVRDGLTIILEEKIKGISILTTDNYIETLIIIKHKKIDLIILDANILGSRNTLMIQEIKNIQPEIKILVFSMYQEETHAHSYIIAGANGYLNKLTKEDKLISTVNIILEEN